MGLPAKTRIDERSRTALVAILITAALIGFGSWLVKSDDGVPHWEGLLPEARAEDDVAPRAETTQEDWSKRIEESSERRSMATSDASNWITVRSSIDSSVDARVVRREHLPYGTSAEGPFQGFSFELSTFAENESPNEDSPVLEMGRLSVLLPYGQTIRENEAVQYTLTPVGKEERPTVIETVIGGRGPQDFRGLKMTSIGIEFDAVAIGDYKVDALVLKKNEAGRWLSTSLRMKCDAVVLVDRTSRCVVR